MADQLAGGKWAQLNGPSELTCPWCTRNHFPPSDADDADCTCCKWCGGSDCTAEAPDPDTAALIGAYEAVQVELETSRHVESVTRSRLSMFEHDHGRQKVELERLRNVDAKLRAEMEFDHMQARRQAVLEVMEARDNARNQLRAETAITKELLQRNVDLGTRADSAEAARDDLRARLEGLRPAGFEYGYGPDATAVSLCGTSTAAYGCAREDGVNVYVMDRYLGPWRAVAADGASGETETGGGKSGP
jgi:hypothetical protein